MEMKIKLKILGKYNYDVSLFEGTCFITVCHENIIMNRIKNKIHGDDNKIKTNL